MHALTACRENFPRSTNREKHQSSRESCQEEVKRGTPTKTTHQLGQRQRTAVHYRTKDDHYAASDVVAVVVAVVECL